MWRVFFILDLSLQNCNTILKKWSHEFSISNVGNVDMSTRPLIIQLLIMISYSGKLTSLLYILQMQQLYTYF